MIKGGHDFLVVTVERLDEPEVVEDLTLVVHSTEDVETFVV